MDVLRYVQQRSKNHSFFIIFFAIGVLLNLNLSFTKLCEREAAPVPSSYSPGKVVNVKVNSLGVASQMQSSSAKKQPVRPRYYSTELGIKEKLFVGVFTSADQVSLRAVAVNKTVAHLVDKIKYFMSASRGPSGRKRSAELGNMVGFTDTRETLRSFHIVKYISDSFVHNYDYFFFMKDSSYLNARLLRHIVDRISVSQDVYMGNRNGDTGSCSLDSGILLSSSVIVAMRANLEWCVRNAFSENHSDNLGRCVAHSVPALTSCQAEVQGQQLTHVRLPQTLRLSGMPNVVLTYPVADMTDMYALHAHHSKTIMSASLKTVEKLERMVSSVACKQAAWSTTWPPGHRAGNRPLSRFDAVRHTYFNATHSLFASDYSNNKPLSAAQHRDVQNVLGMVAAWTHHSTNNTLQFRRLVNGYASFDLSRGLDYQLDIGFRDQATGKESIRRYQVCKPLGAVEMLAMPYVTENKRITILVTVQERDIEDVGIFMESLSRHTNQANKGGGGQKVFVMLALLYEFGSASKGEQDVFLPVKEMAVNMTNRHGQDEGKVAWVSIRLPHPKEVRNRELLPVVVVDLVLKKIGLDALVLQLDMRVELSIDFLNRVRMNTIAGTQIFSPVPFGQYHPLVSARFGTAARDAVHKSVGRFSIGSFDYVSFYGRDYVNARLLAESSVPIARTDKDIQTVLGGEPLSENWNVYKLFVRWSPPGVHCMRATDPGLRVRYRRAPERNAGPTASKAQLAQLMLAATDT